MRRLAVWLVVALGAPAWAASRAVVIVPLTDVRRHPQAPLRAHSDDDEETQLLFDEEVAVEDSSGAWKRIAAIEQPEFSHHQRWEGYPGWVQAAHLGPPWVVSGQAATVRERWASVYDAREGRILAQLPLGARLRVLRQAGPWAVIRFAIAGEEAWIKTADVTIGDVRLSGRGLVRVAALLLGDPYVWGGLSPHDPTETALLSGVDCSGLVHLAYRVNGQRVPRDALEQYLRSTKITRAQLQPGDLIFSAPAETPQKVTHVMLYAGDGEAIEGPQTGMTIRRITLRKKFGVPLSSLESGQTVNGRTVYFGRLLGVAGTGDL